MSAPEPQPARDSAAAKDRLQRIGRFFLSEDGGIFRIAVLTDPADTAVFPLDLLARALARHGRSVAVVDTAGLCSLTLSCPAPGEAASAQERALAALRTPPVPDLALLATKDSGARTAGCDLILLPVPVRSDGMRSAYLRLKALARSGHAPPVGVLITGAAGREEAAAGFGNFARAALRFLDLRVASYSYLAAEHMAHGQRSADTALDGAARLLLRDWRQAAAPLEQARREHP